MMKLLVFKEHLKNIYSRYGIYVNLTMKALAVMIAMLVINTNIGYMGMLKNPLVVIMMGVLAAFLPNGINVLMVSAVIVGHLYELSMEVAVVALVIMLVMYLFYYRFTPGDGYVLLLMPVLFFLKIPYIVPILMGLIATPLAVVSVSFGTIISYIMLYAKNNAGAISNVTDDSGIQKITLMLDNIVKNKEMWIMIVTFAIVVILVYSVRRLSVDYAWSIAVCTGGVANMVIILIGELILKVDASTPIWLMIIMSILSIGIMMILQYMILSVDYSRTEYVQFEDDEYYYYVKTVPKINVATQDVKVKRINAGSSNRRNRR